MADYKEASVSGTAWQRTYQIVINNQVNTIPTVTYHEETAVNLGDKIITSNCGCFMVPCSDMSEVINLLDPVTGADTGEIMTLGKLYQAIYSHYMGKAIVRDTVV